MPYTRSGLGGNYGDYYRGDYYRGDIWSTLGGAVKKAAGAVVGGVSGFIRGGPLAGLGGALKGAGIIKSSNPMQGTALAPSPAQDFSGFQLGPLKVGSSRTPAAPPPEYPVGETHVMPGFKIVPVRKRRGMNPMNAKALKRADRRIDRFTKAVRGALKHTNYQLVRKGSRRGGSPGVITKAEASRALRK